MDEDKAIESPAWWRDRLFTELQARQTAMKQPIDYYEGRHRSLIADDKLRPQLVAMFRALRVNLCQLAVDIVAERIVVEGFRFDADGGTADPEAWAIWQRNGMDAASVMLHTGTQVCGYGAVIVWGDQNNEPIMSVESGQNVVVATDGRLRRAALKVFVDEWTDRLFATLYLPDAIHRWEQAAGNGFRLTVGQQSSTPVTWVPRGADAVVANPLGVVPVVPFVNRPRLNGTGRSELDELIPLQDLTNKTLLDLMTAAEQTAFRQRWATGIEVPIDPATKEPYSPWKPGMDRVWMAEEEKAKFGEFEATDLGNYTGALESIVAHFAAVARVPAHYLLAQEGQWPTGDSLRSAEMALVAKVRARQQSWGEAYEDVMRLAFKVRNDPRAENMAAETAWRDPETRSEAERADALVKRSSIGVPYRRLWLDAGYSEAECDQFDVMLADAIRRGVMARLPVPAAAVQGQTDNTLAGAAAGVPAA